jgi:hypothetical protein
MMGNPDEKCPPYKFKHDINNGCQTIVAQWHLMFEINISACHLGGRGFNSRSNPFPHVIEKATPSDNVGILRGSGFLLLTLQITQYCL